VNDLAARFKEYRYSHGMMTQCELAKLIGISQGMVSLIERGAGEPKSRALYKIEGFFKIKKRSGR
jgi:transcriptional regulator with XRE-family HTH domain